MNPLDLDAVRAALRPEHLAYALRYRRVCDSTQALARAALLEGAGEGSVTVSDEQRAGRGRRGSPWTAPPGRALLFSVILDPGPSLAGRIPLLAGLAVADGIEVATGLRVDLKWPNDVMAAGRKLAGILAERPPGNAIVLGIGLNVNQSPDELPAGTPATSLAILLGRQLPREPVLASLLNALDRGCARLRREGGGWLAPAWRRRSSMLGQPVEVTMDGTRTTGVAEDIDVDGTLIIRLADGRRRAVIAGTVSHLRTTPRLSRASPE